MEHEPRFVVLTSGVDYPEDVLEGLSLAGIVPAAVLVSQGAIPRKKRKPRRQGAATKSLAGKLGDKLKVTTPKQLALRASEIAYGRLEDKLRYGGDRRRAKWGAYADRVEFVGPLNGSVLVGTLQGLAPDYLILAQIGIVGEDVLRVPKLGTLNVHPAILPFARGVGVVEHSVLRGHPVGVTGHFVAPGIDTGELIHRELVPVTPNDTLASLRKKAERRCRQLLVELAVKARDNRLEGIAQNTRFPYCKRPTLQESALAAESVAKGKARLLYEQWFERLGTHVLPNDPDIGLDWSK